MDKLTLQIKAVCLVSILTGVMGCIIPYCRLKKAFSSFSAVVIVFTLMMPFASFGKVLEEYRLNDFTAEREEASVQFETAELMIYKRVIEVAIAESLSESGITASISVECENEDDGYRITSFTVSGCSEEEKGKICDYLSRGFGDVPVFFKGG